MLGSAQLKFNSGIEIPSAVKRSSYNVETPHRLLSVAAKIFAERGYRAVTLKDIVAAAGVNNATAHYHFGDKAGLYRAVIREQLRLRDQQISMDEQELRQIAPSQRLNVFISRLMQQLLLDEEHQFMSRLMLWEAIDPGPAFSVAVRHLPQHQLDLLSRIIRDMTGGRLSHRQIRASAISILGQCVFYRYGRLILARTERQAPRTAAAVQEIADHIHDFSVAALNSIGKRLSVVRMGTPRPRAAAPSIETRNGRLKNGDANART
jgi:TetR/AcrR family transcriptional regulator, regulator of cefoperazone and chloramphenicol sensitivity